MTSTASAPELPQRRAHWRSWTGVALAALLPFAAGCLVHSQGIDLMDDGLWLLGARVLADGGWPHRDLTVADGPGRFALLLPWWWAAGRSALGLALLKAACDAGAGALGFWAARRMGAQSFAWIAPLGVIALAPVPPVLLASSTVVLAGALGLERRWRARRWLAWGATLGATSAFGPGPPALATIGFAMSALLQAVARRRLPKLAGSSGPLAATAGAMLALGAVATLHATRGALGLAWNQECVEPAARWWEQWQQGGAASWLHALRSAPRLAIPFADVETGERLAAAWPAHAALRALGWRALYLGMWLVPVAAGLWALRGRRGGLAAGIAAWAWCGWWVLLPAGDLAHLRAAWWAGLPALATLLSAAARSALAERRRAGLVGLVILGTLVAALLPAFAERSWLGAHARRAGLMRLQSERGGISLSEARALGWERARDALLARGDARAGGDAGPGATAGARAGADPGSDLPVPGLIWPHQPGLYFLWDLPLPTAQVTLAPGAVLDPSRVLAQLEASRPARGLLGLSPSVSGTYIRRAAPTIWAYLRQHYRVEDILADSPDPFRVLARASGGHTEILSLPLVQRLADFEQPVANDVGPALRPEFTVGQSFPVGPLDLAGIAVRWRTRGTNVAMRLRVGIWQEQGGAFDTLLEFFDVDVTVAGDLDRSYLRLTPVASTAGTTVAVTFELIDAVQDEVRLMWHRHDGPGGSRDLFPEGTALVGMAPVAADLWFYAY